MRRDVRQEIEEYSGDDMGIMGRHCSWRTDWEAKGWDMTQQCRGHDTPRGGPR